MGYHRISVPIGSRYSMLTVFAEFGKKTLPSGQKIRVVRCVCDCGNYTDVIVAHLVRNRIKSCGCLTKTKKGESNTTLHRRWKSIIERCYMDSRTSSIYRDRGIAVCDEWKDFFVFKEWALKNGYKHHLQIDRIDNEKGYSPDNCRYVTSKENCNNRRITQYVMYHGERLPFTYIMDKKGITLGSQTTIRGRIKRGWSHDDAIDTPIKKGNYKRNILTT